MIVNTLKQVLLAINLVVHPVARTIAAASLPSRNILQQTISTTVMADKKEKVPGDNFAYYCGPTPSSEQLFEIEEYDIAPNPPVVYVTLPSIITTFSRIPDIRRTETTACLAIWEASCPTSPI